MGKKNSWLKTMKNAFKSSSASSSRDSSDKRVEWSSSQRDDEYEEEGYENMMPEIVSVEHFPSMDGDCEEEDEYASVVEMAAEAAAEAAKKAVRLMRMAKYGRRPSREEMAAVVVQSCFRGYLARRARRALRALVRLQAIVRGCTVRKQAQLTMQCMQSLVRVQARARATRLNLLTSPNPNKNIHTIKQCYGNNDLYTISDYNEIDDESGRYNVSSKSPASICCKNLPESMLDREKELAYAFSCQERPQLGWNWLERRMSTDQELLRSLPDSSYTSKTNNVLDNLSEKTVEIDSDLTKYTPKIHFPPQHDDDDDQEGQRMKRMQVIPSYMVATQSAKAKVRGNYSRFDVQRRAQNRRHSGYSPDSSCGDRTPPFRGRLGKNES